MLQNIRDNAQGTISKIIVGFIVFTFAIFGVDSIIGGFGGEAEVASVDGVGIMETELLRAVDSKRRQIISQQGANADPALLDDAFLKKSVLDSLINQQVLINDAEKADLYLSDQALDQMITEFQEFHQGGKFDNDLLVAFLRNMGLSMPEFRRMLRKDIVVSQYRNAIAGSSFVLPNELTRLMRLDRETRTFDLATLLVADFMSSVNATEDEIVARFESDKNAYLQPDTVDVTYLEISKDQVMSAIVVSEAELKSRYEEFVKTFKGAEERKALHILIEINDQVSREDAMARAQEISREISEGLGFSIAAEKYSDDIGTAKRGGLLGYVTQGTLDEEVDAVLFKLNSGQVSGPVLSDYGYHLVKVEDIREETVPVFDAVKVSLELEIKGARAEKELVAMAEKLADITYASNGLSEAAKELGLEMKTQLGIKKGAGEGDFAHPAMQKTLFSDDVLQDGRNTDVVEVTKDRSLVAHVSRFQPMHTKDLADVREEIALAIKSDKAGRMVRDRAKEIVTALKDGKVSEETNWIEHNAVVRNYPEEDQAVMNLAFSLSVDPVAQSIGFVQLDSGDVKLLRLKSVQTPNIEELTSDQKEGIEKLLGSTFGGMDYQLYRQSLKSRTQIEKL